jgi:hypothetical protein
MEQKIKIEIKVRKLEKLETTGAIGGRGLATGSVSGWCS